MNLPITKKSLGQHWLTDLSALTAMCDAVEVMIDDTVLEIGPGTGTLTKQLVVRADKVIAVEFDESLARSLPTAVKADNLSVVHSDIMTFDLSNLPPDYKVVANIPYYLTSNLIRTLSEASNSPSDVALLVQKEVAQRVAAQPGSMSLLSVTAQYYWDTSLGMVVPSKLFTPSPKIDSQILILKRRATALFAGVDTQGFFRLVKAGFAARRKTLLNSLSAGLRQDKEQVQTMLDAAGISPRLRPQELSLNDWYTLYKHMERA